MKFTLTSRLLRLILIGCLALSVIVFIGTTFYGMSILNKKSQKLVSLKADSQSSYNELVNLVQAKKEVQKYAYFKSIANNVIPNDKNQAEAVLEINQMAKESGIAIQSISFPASTLGGVAGATTGAAGSSSTHAAITQAKPVPGISGLYSLQLTITPAAGKDVPPNLQVTYPKMLTFLKKIENNRHTAQITQVGIQPASDSQALSFTLVINIFIKP
jgi:hypothetical protein